MCSLSNQTPVSSCMYSNSWIENKEIENCWIRREADDFYVSHVTAPADALENNIKDEQEIKMKRNYCAYKHVPHKDKPPQVVAKRNARERRRVQAVNGAFVKLRKAIPIENTRGKRISKVKTLQKAIEYIKSLKKLLQEHSDEEDMIFDDCQKGQEYYFHSLDYIQET